MEFRWWRGKGGRWKGPRTTFFFWQLAKIVDARGGVVTTRSELRRAWMGPRNCECSRRGVSMAPSEAVTIGDTVDDSYD